MRNWFDLVYLTAARARDYGFTHHGRVYGVPAWLTEQGPDMIMACPKITLLQAYVIAMDKLAEFILGFMPADVEFVLPAVFGQPIEVDNGDTAGV